MVEATPLADLLAETGRDALPEGWTGGTAEYEDGVLTRRFATHDGEQVVFYAVREDGTATLARATWDGELGEYLVGPDRAERALNGSEGRAGDRSPAATDRALLRAALSLMTGDSEP